MSYSKIIVKMKRCCRRICVRLTTLYTVQCLMVSEAICANCSSLDSSPTWKIGWNSSLACVCFSRLLAFPLLSLLSLLFKHCYHPPLLNTVSPWGNGSLVVSPGHPPTKDREILESYVDLTWNCWRMKWLCGSGKKRKIRRLLRESVMAYGL